MADSDPDVKINGSSKLSWDKLKGWIWDGAKSLTFAGLAMYLVQVMVDEMRQTRTSFVSAATKAHEEFREDDKEKWAAVREQSDQCRELQRSIRRHQLVMEGTQQQLKEAVEEMKKNSMKTGAGGP